MSMVGGSIMGRNIANYWKFIASTEPVLAVSWTMGAVGLAFATLKPDDAAEKAKLPARFTDNIAGS